MKTKTLLKKRAWLNKDPSQAAAIFVKVAQEQYLDTKTKKQIKSVDTQCEIRDCSRTINLDFGLYESEGNKVAKNNLDKIDLLINTLSEFRDALEEAYAWKEN